MDKDLNENVIAPCVSNTIYTYEINLIEAISIALHVLASMQKMHEKNSAVVTQVGQKHA